MGRRRVPSATIDSGVLYICIVDSDPRRVLLSMALSFGDKVSWTAICGIVDLLRSTAIEETVGNTCPSLMVVATIMGMSDFNGGCIYLFTTFDFDGD